MGRRTKGGGPRPGRRLKHAGRALERAIRENTLDGRTTTSRMLRSIESDLAADAGGEMHMTARERALLRRCAAQVLILESIEGWVFGQQSVLDSGGEMLAVLRKGYIGHLNSLRLNLLALGLRPERADKLPSLAEYVASRANGNAQGATENDATGDPRPETPTDLEATEETGQ